MSSGSGTPTWIIGLQVLELHNTLMTARVCIPILSESSAWKTSLLDRHKEQGCPLELRGFALASLSSHHIIEGQHYGIQNKAIYLIIEICSYSHCWYASCSQIFYEYCRAKIPDSTWYWTQGLLHCNWGTRFYTPNNSKSIENDKLCQNLCGAYLMALQKLVWSHRCNKFSWIILSEIK